MNKERYCVWIFAVMAVTGCSPIASRLAKTNNKVKVTQAADTLKKSPVPKEYITNKDLHRAGKISFTQKNDGSVSASVWLDQITVVSKSRNIAERAGKISIDFKVSVPSELINNKWQVRLTPFADKNGKRIEFDKILLSGADFLKRQQKGYRMYQNFVNSIIPDSAYMQNLFDQKGYQKALGDIEQMFYMAWQKEMLSQDRFVDWKNIRNKRFLLFNGIMERNKSSINPNDWRKVLPAYHLQRNISNVPSEWDMFLNANFSIKPTQMTAKDSIDLSKKFFNYKRMAENERKKASVDKMFKEFVIFPKEECKLDTIIENGDKFDYYYKQTIDADENIKKIFLTVDGEVLAIDQSEYNLPKSDTITYYISSMVQFLDRTPHYKRIIVSRHAEANTTAYITFPVGSTKFVATEDNRQEIDKVLRTLHDLTFTGELVLDSVNMTATASPEGNALSNLRLSHQRSGSLKKYLLEKVDNADDIKLFRPRAIGEDWSGLSTLIGADSTISNKSEAFDIIENTIHFDSRENKLKALPEYAHIKKTLYPKLRAVKFDFFLHRREMVKDTIHTTVIDTAYMAAVQQMEDRQYRAALKTLTEYNDYNTALCYMSLGYDTQAVDILEKCNQTADVYYLLAILYSRMKRDEDAIAAFKKSCEIDSSKFYRGALDPEINQLIINYQLKNLNE